MKSKSVIWRVMSIRKLVVYKMIKDYAISTFPRYWFAILFVIQKRLW